MLCRSVDDSTVGPGLSPSADQGYGICQHARIGNLLVCLSRFEGGEEIVLERPQLDDSSPVLCFRPSTH
jgi:hypothetical protein